MDPTAVKVNSELVNQLMKMVQDPKDLFGPEGLFQRLKGALVERILEAEMSEHLGYEANQTCGRARSNTRNGHTFKTLQTETGPLEIEVPRDRKGTFEPKLVAKHQRRLDGFDEKVLALYARGLSTRDIQGHLYDVYGTEISPELISRVTDAVSDEVRGWQQRPLEEIYPIVYLDALYLPIREGGVVVKKAAYLAMGVTLEGDREVLGLWLQQAEGAKFWLHVLTELKNRGVRDILYVCCDGLTGFPKAIGDAFPQATVQTCIVHMIRNSLRYVGYQERKEVVASLKPIYTAATEDAAEDALKALETKWNKKYPSIAKSWRTRWSEVIPFLSYPHEIRKMLYTTNCIESLNSQLRKAIRPKGAFPNDDAALKVLFLAIQRAAVKWKRPVFWNSTRAQLAIHFPGRIPA